MPAAGVTRSSQSPAPPGTALEMARKTGTASATMTIVTAAAPRRVMAPTARAPAAATAANSPVPMITFTSVAVDTGAAE